MDRFLRFVKQFFTMADEEAARIASPEEIRTAILKKLVETGEKDRLKEILSDRLIQCGWRDELKEYCKAIIRKKGLEKVTVEELVAEITPHGRCRLFFLCQSFLYDIVFSDRSKRHQSRIARSYSCFSS